MQQLASKTNLNKHTTHHSLIDVLQVIGSESEFGVLVHLFLLSQNNDVITLWLRLTATSNCFPNPCETYRMCLNTLICWPLANSSSHTQFEPPYLAQILGFLVDLWSQNDVITSWLRLTATSNCFWNPYYIHTKCLSTLICHPLANSIAAFNSLLGTSLRDTYVMYPYHESHGTRALFSQECHLYMRYLYTTRKSM